MKKPTLQHMSCKPSPRLRRSSPPQGTMEMPTLPPMELVALTAREYSDKDAQWALLETLKTLIYCTSLSDEWPVRGSKHERYDLLAKLVVTDFVEPSTYRKNRLLENEFSMTALAQSMNMDNTAFKNQWYPRFQKLSLIVNTWYNSALFRLESGI